MTRILKRPADASSSLRLPVRVHEARSTARAAGAETGAQAVPSVDVAALKAEVAALREQAMREGLAQGRAQAEQELGAALEAELRQWRTALESLEAALSQKLRAIEPLVVAIGYEAFATVLGEAHAHGDAIVPTARRLVEAAAASTQLCVRVAPANLERVRAALAQGQPAPGRLRFEADVSLSATECRVVSERGQWESSLALQLQTVQDALLRASEGLVSEGRA